MQGNVILCAVVKINKKETFTFKDTSMNNSKEEKENTRGCYRQ